MGGSRPSLSLSLSVSLSRSRSRSRPLSLALSVSLLHGRTREMQPLLQTLLLFANCVRSEHGRTPGEVHAGHALAVRRLCEIRAWSDSCGATRLSSCSPTGVRSEHGRTWMMQLLEPLVSVEKFANLCEIRAWSDFRFQS